LKRKKKNQIFKGNIFKRDKINAEKRSFFCIREMESNDISVN